MEIINKIIETNKTSTNIKKQIVLTHTSINVKSYLKSLKLRHFGNYDKIPNYVITKEGYILNTLEDNQYTNLLSSKLINSKSITISLENLGWLEKEPLKNYHINWIGDIYKEKVFEKKWREKFFWDPYTEKQIDSLDSELVTLQQEQTQFEIEIQKYRDSLIVYDHKIDSINL